MVVVFYCKCTGWPPGLPGVTTFSGGTVQQPYGRYQLEPTSPTSVESMRMVTLRIKLDTNMVQGGWQWASLECCVIRYCVLLRMSSASVTVHGLN